MHQNKIYELSKVNVAKLLTVHGYGQVGTILNQIGIIPLLVIYWGADGFGHWVKLTSIAALVVLMDMGISRAAIDRVSVLLGQNRRFEALYLFKFLFSAYSVIYVIIALSISTIIFLLDLSTASINIFTALILIFEYAAKMIDAVLHAGYRICEKTAMHWFLYYTCALVQFMSISILGASGYGMLDVAISFLLIRIIFLLYTFYKLPIKGVYQIFLRRLHPHIFLRLKDSTKANFFHLSGLVLNQYGINLLISYFLPAKSLAIFTIYRTAGRVASQVVQVLFNSVDHELGKKISIKNMMRIIYSRRSLYILLCVLVIFPLSLYYIILEWASDRIESNFIACIGVILASVFEAAFFLILYSNRIFGEHKRIARNYLQSTIFLLATLTIALHMHPKIEVTALIYLIFWFLLFILNLKKQINN